MAYGYLIKKVHSILLYDAGQFYVKQDGGQIKICETFSGNSLKEDLSIDTTFDPCYFSWDSLFNIYTKITNGWLVHAMVYDLKAKKDGVI